MSDLLLILGLVILILALFAFFRKKSSEKAGSAAAQPAQKKLSAASKSAQLAREIRSTPAKSFKKEMRLLSSQTERMDSKLDSLDRALQDYFGNSISYNKFAGTVLAVDQVFVDNSEKILRRIDVFDEEGYNDLFRRHQEYTDAIKPYQEHFDYVKAHLDENERILSQLDKLMLEVNNLNDTRTPIDQLPAMQEINDLIEQTKLYRQN